MRELEKEEKHFKDKGEKNCKKEVEEQSSHFRNIFLRNEANIFLDLDPSLPVCIESTWP
jgi:hypothetical protein